MIKSNLDLLSEESKTFINIMWNYWQQVKNEYK